MGYLDRAGQVFTVQNTRSFYINGEWVKPAGEQVLEVVSPHSEEVFMTFAEGTIVAVVRKNNRSAP